MESYGSMAHSTTLFLAVSLLFSAACAADLGEPLCDELTGECVECRNNEHCNGSDARICDEGTCVGCRDSSDCTDPRFARCEEGACVFCRTRGDCRGVVDGDGLPLDACTSPDPDNHLSGTCQPLPEWITLSPDDEGYCWEPTGPSCDCTRLDYFCDWVPCRGARYGGVCDAHPSTFREIVDEHGCPGYDVTGTEPACFK